ncbi:MAG: sugar ABC transporter substrate-binding protein [Rhizobiales bacterium]|nr:sugar ABC transporter substrate-binding protein [Hyphomicrobiales bacterium]
MRVLSKILGAVALTAVCITSVSAKEVTVGMSWNNKDSLLETAWEDYLKAEGERQGKEAGIDFTWVFNVANGDPARQAANIEDLINRGVDIVMARAEDAAAIGASIRAAEAAGIPFVTFDRASTAAKPSAHVGGDSYDQAVTTATTFIDMLKSTGVQAKCIELQGALTDVNAVNRSQGWKETTENSGVVTTVAQVPTEWNPELFRSGLSNALKANPDANCVFAASDFAFPAIQSALEDAGKWAPTGDPNHIWLATQDLMSDAVKAMEAGYIDVSTTYDAYAHAKEAVRVLIAIAKGEDPACGPDGCLAKGRVATPENVKTMENLWSRAYQ